ncbi:XdhC family protein [Kineosporia babensis]|uniref:XdhC family protein n=1 Tax=Kineosporia babensis TaxID=499548 RepID=A0A9X1NLC8_9ACTN|nr:XdhC family protein [Kineosporia babensis]
MPERAVELSAQRVPFVRATVVRAQVPSSAQAGDEALVLMDGSIEGFVGGQCAESSVRAAALGTLAAGETLLLRVLPEEVGFPETPGAQVVVNPCLSGGALEIFLRPVLPPPLVQVIGQTPVARAVVEMGELLGYDMQTTSPSPVPKALIIASHGRDDEAGAVRTALDDGVGYVALVASQKRGQAVLDELGLSPAERERVSSPAGLWIGARTPGEIALSIMAEVVAALRLNTRPGPALLEPSMSKEPAAPQGTPNSTLAIDPVCGMQVVTTPGTPHAEVNGTDIWFCGEGCRAHYLTEQDVPAEAHAE